jgi:uncharacterized protein (DUF952 family)
MIIYKILTREDWSRWRRDQRFTGSAVDLQDGYIHLSTHVQVRETAARHFAGQEGLVLVEIESEALGASLRWEPSRGGQLFPHHYGALDFSFIRLSWPLPWNGEVHLFPASVPAA